MNEQKAERPQVEHLPIFGIPVVVVDDMPDYQIVLGLPIDRQIITLTAVGDGTFVARVKTDE
jgi:hypothetical protein